MNPLPSTNNHPLDYQVKNMIKLYMRGREILRERSKLFFRSQDFHLPQNLSLPLASLMADFAGDPFPPTMYRFVLKWMEHNVLDPNDPESYTQYNLIGYKQESISHAD